MDRPEEIHCWKCQTSLGYLNGDRWVFTCPSCQALSQPGPGDSARQATARVIHLQDQWDRLEKDFQEQARVFHVSVWGGRQIGFRHYPPDVATNPGPYVAALLLWIGAVALVYVGWWWLAPLAIVTGVWLVRSMNEELAKKREGYKALQTHFEREKAALHDEIDKAIRSEPDPNSGRGTGA